MPFSDHHELQEIAEQTATLRDIRKLLRGIAHDLHVLREIAKPGPVSITFTRAVYEDGTVAKDPMSVSLKSVQHVTLTAGCKDAQGLATPLPTFDSPPVWLSANPAVVTVVPAADGLTAVATAVGADGTVNITVNASVAGVAMVQGAIDVVVGPGGGTGGTPVAMTITAGTPAP